MTFSETAAMLKDAVFAGDAATSQLEDAEIEPGEENKLPPMVNAVALANWTFQQSRQPQVVALHT